MLDVVLPERCAVCDAPGRPLCDPCRRAFARIVPPVCARCGSPGSWPVRRCAECAGRRLAFTEARAAIVYDARARAFVREWKEHGRRRLACEAAALVAEVVRRPDADGLVPVPGDPERAWQRGRVAPHALAVELGRIWHLNAHNLLARSRALPRQRGLSLEERRRNVRGSVVLRGTDVPRAICLVDDVYTSGATAAACAAAARRGGARRVTVVTLARAVR